jgi:hypothetical protein
MMHHSLQKTLLLFLLVLFCAQPLFALESYQEGIHIIRPDSKYIIDNYAIPEYLTVEDLTFISCLEEEYVPHNSLLCLDDNSFEELETIPWSLQDNCYISSYNLEGFECDQLMLQAEYIIDEENYKLTKLVRVNKLSTVLDTLLDTQYSDGGWQDPLSTVYGIWALSYFRDLFSYELDIALDWLKTHRNEERKCWPKSPCNIETSANILAVLTLSNYTGEIIEQPDAKRIVNDARNLFEELQNLYAEGDTWNVTIEAVNNDTTLTLVAYDAEILDENFSLPVGEPESYSFVVGIYGKLVVISDDVVKINVSNMEGEVLVEYQGDNLSYTIPGPCWSLNKKAEPCDYTTSLFTMVSDIDEEQKDLAKDWAREEIKEGEILGSYFGDGDEDIIDTSLYLYNLYEDDKALESITHVIDWMLYTQNNEGSWGTNYTTDKSLPTAYSVLALGAAGFNRTTEPIEDAEHWASINEDEVDDNETVALASIFFILKQNARPLLVAEPKVIVVEKPTMTIQLFNPTMFNLDELTYEFSEDIEKSLTIQTREEIGAYSYRKMLISRTGTETTDAFGYLTITNKGDPVAKIPVILTDTPIMNITLPEKITVFGKKGDLRITAQKSPHTLTCMATWDDNEISTPGSVRVTSGSFILPLSFSQSVTKEDSYTGTLSCLAVGKTITMPLFIYVSRYAKVPLTITPTDAVINTTTDDIIISLTNNLDQDLTITASLDRYGSYFSFSNSLTLNPNEQLNFTLTNNLPQDLNLTSSLLLTFTVFDRAEVVSLLVDITEQAFVPKNSFMTLLPLIIILIALAIGGYFVWKFREVIILELNKLNFIKVKQEKKKESKKIKTLKSSEQKQAIVNLYNIMKFQNKSERDIAKRLVTSFTRADVKAALEETGVALAVLDEEDPERLEPKKK